MSEGTQGRDEGFVKTVDSMIGRVDEIKSLGKPGVLRQPTVFPFFFEIDIADSVSSSVNFTELQGTSMQEFAIESDGEITINSNLWQLLSTSNKLALNGEFRKEVPTGFEMPIDFVPKIEFENNSGSTRKMAFSGWLTSIARR